MVAKDTFHDNVKTALEKDGWTITHDPLYLRIELMQIYRTHLRSLLWSKIGKKCRTQVV